MGRPLLHRPAGASRTPAVAAPPGCIPATTDENAPLPGDHCSGARSPASILSSPASMISGIARPAPGLRRTVARGGRERILGVGWIMRPRNVLATCCEADNEGLMPIRSPSSHPWRRLARLALVAVLGTVAFVAVVLGPPWFDAFVPSSV